MSFERLFNPRGIAIVGASADLTRIGGHPIRALRNAGYKGRVYPVNPKRTEIAGLTCYPSVAAIDGACDLAIVAVPAASAPEAVRACGEAGIAFAVVFTAGFRETGTQGRALEDALAAAAKDTGIRVIGPNCQGMLALDSRVWAVFGSLVEESDLRVGRVSGCFQSGGFGFGIVNLAEQQGVGFRVCVSTGNETDVTTPELLLGFLDDPGCEMAFALLEGTPDARRLLEVGRRSLQTGKPVLVWKSAQTEAGAKAAASHTANMTGAGALYRAALAQSGLVAVDDVEPITDMAKLVAQGRLPQGPRVGILSISGGSSIVFADRALEAGLTLPPFEPKTLDAMRAVIPTFGSPENPADVTAAIFNDLSILTRALDIVLADPNIDQIAILLASIPGVPALRVAEAIAAVAARTDKPITVGWSGRRSKSEEAYQVLEAARVPVVPTPVRLAAAMGRLTRFAMDRARLGTRSVPAPMARPVGLALPDGAATLSETESKRILAAFGVPVTREILVREGEDAAAAAAAAGLAAPYAVKVVSADIAHKSDVGGVALGVAAGQPLTAAVADVIASGRRAVSGARINGAIVAEMARGQEVLIGVVNDASFGPAVALALGGVAAEVLGDVVYRIAPFGIETAREMIEALRSAPLLKGYRGAPPADVEALAGLLVSVSSLAMTLGERLAELDINPVFVRPEGQGVVAADALLVLT